LLNNYIEKIINKIIIKKRHELTEINSQNL
jgi:hypothetical protein